MAIFTSENKFSDGPTNQNSGGATIIAQGTRIKGDINIECRLHIDGEFDGTINSKDTVMIGKNGIVIGDIFANTLIVSGKLKGTTQGQSVEIKAQGKIEGTITASELVIERKGIFIGESKIKDAKESKSEKSSINDLKLSK